MYHLQVYKRYPVVFVKGKGIKLYDTNNKEYLDFLAGISVVNAGHCNEKIVEAIKKQAEELIHVSNLFYTIPQVELAERLVNLSGLNKVFFCNSGAESNEAAIKFIRKWGKQHNKDKIVSFYNSFHGRTYGALSATPKDKFREGFEPFLEGFEYLPYNDEEKIKELDNKVAGIILELVQGEGGVIPAKEEFIKTLKDVCEDKNILLVVDEVQTGVGRTGTFFAYEQYNITPNIVTLAKALGNGVPIGAVILDDEVSKYIKYGDHGTTFGGNPLVCAASLATIDIILELIKNKKVIEKGNYFIDKLKKFDYEFIRDVRGKGLMVGIELEFNANDIVNKMLKKGFVINATSDKVLRFLPPLIVEKEHIDLMVDNLKDVFEEIKND